MELLEWLEVNTFPEEAKYKDKGIEDISEGIKDGTISFKKSAKEQDETSYE